MRPTTRKNTLVGLDEISCYEILTARFNACHRSAITKMEKNYTY